MIVIVCIMPASVDNLKMKYVIFNRREFPEEFSGFLVGILFFIAIFMFRVINDSLMPSAYNLINSRGHLPISISYRTTIILIKI